MVSDSSIDGPYRRIERFDEAFSKIAVLATAAAVLLALGMKSSLGAWKLENVDVTPLPADTVTVASVVCYDAAQTI